MDTNITPDPETNGTNTTEPITHEESASLRRLLARAGHTYDLVIARALEEAEMDDLPMRGISILRRIGKGEEGTPLASVLRSGRISRQHGTQLIDTLVERGYIVRETDPEDRRRMRVTLTERGAAAAEAVRTALDSLNASLRERVSAEQVEATQAVLAALIDLAPEGMEPDAGWGPGPGRGFDPRGFGGRRGPDPRVHGPGHGHGRGPGRGPRGPMRDFDGGVEGRERFRERMQAFATRAESSIDPEGERRPRHGRGCGHGGHHRHEHQQGATPLVYIDTVVVQAESRRRDPDRGWKRDRRHEDRSEMRGRRPFGPWRHEGDRPEAPTTDVPPTE